jgi:hypothetical protein
MRAILLWDGATHDIHLEHANVSNGIDLSG